MNIALYKGLTTVCLGLLLAMSVRAEDTYDTLTIGTNVYHNVRIIQTSPVDLLLGHDDGFKRVKLQELPDALRAKYPYNADKAAEYQKKQAQEARLLEQQRAAAVRGNLLAREAQIREKIKPLETELKRLNKDIATLDRKKNAGGKRQANLLRDRKLQVRDKIWDLRDELERTEHQRKRFE